MKRVACLLLCAVLLLGLLPAAALADGEGKLYFEQCDADGTPDGDGRVSGMDVSYGDTVYFRAYTAETGGVTVTGDALHLWDDGTDTTEDALDRVRDGRPLRVGYQNRKNQHADIQRSRRWRGL